MKTIKYILLSAILIGFSSCSEDDSNDMVVEPLPELTTGSADFSKYVAVGASFTAGYTDGGLFIAGQENSFPKIMSEQFAMGGGGSFTQPLMNDNTGGILVGGTPATGYRLVFGGAGPVPLNTYLTNLGAPVPPITTEAGNNIGSNFNNFGIPGAKSWHLVTPGYAALSPYYARIASAPTATVLADAMAQSPTFFSLSEVGGNDVLGYATTGGDGTNTITPIGQFDTALNALVNGLTSNGAKGVVTNVPYITDLPHFTTVPYNALNPSNPALAPQIPTLNAQLYGPLDNIFTAYGEPNRVNPLSTTMANPVLIHDETAINRSAEITGALTPVLGAQTAAVFGAIFGQARQATASDLLVLPSSSVIATTVAGIPAPVNVNGVSYPLQDKWVLLPSEQLEIRNATDAYNASISSVAASKGLALVDLNAILTQAASSGIEFDDYQMNTSLVFGGLVSLDGVHLTSRGYALMANKFLDAIDATYGSNFRASGNVAKAGNYPTNFTPALQ